MANAVKINLGSLGCLGGEGNLRNVDLHDSTCQCEGCVEKRLAERGFSIITDNVFGEKDFGFNEGDADGFDDESSSSSDDEPSDDAGYYDDGQDSEDMYSVYSPKPCANEEENSDDDIEEEDTPLPKDASFDDIIDNASIEASKRNGQMIDDYIRELDTQEHNTVQMKELDSFMDHHRFKAAQFWKEQINFYESKITTLFKELSKSENVIRAAKRCMDYDTKEINRLRDLCMQKTRETNEKDKQLYTMAEDMG